MAAQQGHHNSEKSTNSNLIFPQTILLMLPRYILPITAHTDVAKWRTPGSRSTLSFFSHYRLWRGDCKVVFYGRDTDVSLMRDRKRVFMRGCTQEPTASFYLLNDDNQYQQK